MVRWRDSASRQQFSQAATSPPSCRRASPAPDSRADSHASRNIARNPAVSATRESVASGQKPPPSTDPYSDDADHIRQVATQQHHPERRIHRQPRPQPAIVRRRQQQPAVGHRHSGLNGIFPHRTPPPQVRFHVPPRNRTTAMPAQERRSPRVPFRGGTGYPTRN